MALSIIASLASCSLANAAFGSLSREQTQGEWTAVVHHHTVYLDLSSNGTVTVTGIPVAALKTFDSADDTPVPLDWNRVAHLTGTWSFFESYAGNPASIDSDLTNSSTHKVVSAGLSLEGKNLVIYYGNIEDNYGLTFTRTAHQLAQPRQQLLSRDAFVGTWGGGTAAHNVTVTFDADGSMHFSGLPLDLLRSDGTAQIDWRHARSFTAGWLWPEDPITPDSFISVDLYPRPPGTEFDSTVMDVHLDGSMITLRMRSGLVSWNRHIDLHRRTP